MGHPTWDDTQTVSRRLVAPSAGVGMPTVSTTRPSESLSNSFTVPSELAAVWCTSLRPTHAPADAREARHEGGRPGMSASDRAGRRPYSPACSCRPLNAGWACDAASASQADSERPSSATPEAGPASEAAADTSASSARRHAPSSTPPERGTTVAA